jgi:hypothetical protein
MSEYSYEQYYLLGCETVYSGRILPTFWRNTLPFLRQGLYLLSDSFLVVCFAFSLTSKLDVVHSCKMSKKFYRTARRRNSEDKTAGHCTYKLMLFRKRGVSGVRYNVPRILLYSWTLNIGVVRGGVQLVHSPRRPPIGLLCQPRVIMGMENLVE